MQSPEATPSRGSVKHGVCLLLLLHLLQLVWLFDEPIMIWLIGITQVCYVLPAVIVLFVQRKTKTVGGVLLCAAITVALNFATVSIICGDSTGIGG